MMFDTKSSKGRVSIQTCFFINTYTYLYWNTLRGGWIGVLANIITDDNQLQHTMCNQRV